MFRMDNYLEKWSSEYKPVSHQIGGTGKVKRFYRVDSITSIAPFLTNLIHASSPSVGYITQIDASLCGASNKLLRLDHRVFFFVKQAGGRLQNGITEEIAAMDAKLLGAEMAQDLLAYIRHDQKVNGNKDLAGIELDGATFFTTPQQFNGWWPTECVFQQVVSRDLCKVQEKYYSSSSEAEADGKEVVHERE